MLWFHINYKYFSVLLLSFQLNILSIIVEKYWSAFPVVRFLYSRTTNTMPALLTFNCFVISLCKMLHQILAVITILKVK